MSIDSGLLIIRVAVGLILLAHGVKHARGREKTSNWFGSIGFRQPMLQWFLSSATEIGVGILLIVGALSSLAAAGVIGILTVAFFSVHRAAGFWITARPDEGWEYVFVLIAAAFALAIAGPGDISIDAEIGLADILDGWVGFAIGVFGFVGALGQMMVFYRPGERVDG